MPERPRVVHEERLQRGKSTELRLRVSYDGALYRVAVREALDANQEPVGFYFWVGNATPLLGGEQRALDMAMTAVTMLHPRT